MTLPHGTASAIERALGMRIAHCAALGGGCISPAYHVRSAEGHAWFVKLAPAGAPVDMMRQEALSLRALAAANAVRVPAVVAVADEWLVLEWLPPARASSTAWSELGRALARLHATRVPRFGWDTDNYIGPLRQANDRTDDWAAFWRERRLAPQLALAADLLGSGTAAEFRHLFDRLDEALAPAAADGATLLHGDLWNGNVHFTTGAAALIDPSCYHGHREVDLAMAALFGGFPDAFLDAYSAEFPLLAGADARRPIYQLYYLLVHVNLFGAAYVAQTQAALRAALR